MPKVSCNIRTQIWTNLILIVLGLLPNLTRRLKYDFSEISRASRVILLPLNKLLSLKKRSLETRNEISHIFFMFRFYFT
jgi:hypothetical protein